MDRVPDSVVYISEAPRIEIAEGIAKTIARSGSTEQLRVMSIPDFSRFIERGQRALRRLAAGDETIIVGD